MTGDTTGTTQEPGQSADSPFPHTRLRGALNFGNALFTGRDENGGPVGLGMDLMRALAADFGAELEILSYAQPGDVVVAANADAWDVAILAIEPAREEFVSFAAPMTRIEASCVVDAALPDTPFAELDRPGFRIAAMARGGYELYLSRTLKQASVVKTASFAESIERFNGGEADAVAGLTTMLAARLPDMPRGRLMAESFQTIHHGFAVPHHLAAALPAISDFVARRAGAVIADAIRRHGINGLTPLTS
ncbi:transporter substrate-binding domain-containing protein [Azorhizobium oxalatiphilum]|nr:transporter substrate-binding domain-containing protein [Azorhizobium oxalatiphilum]